MTDNSIFDEGNNMGKLFRNVAVIGAGMSKFGKFDRKTNRELWVEAFLDSKKSVDNDIDVKNVEALFLGNYSSDLFEKQTHTAPLMADLVGLTPKAAMRIEDACASSGVALRLGVLAIASGQYDIVCVGGTEKMTNLTTTEVTDVLAAASDTHSEVLAGATFPGLYATMATAHMAKFGTTEEQLMAVTIKNHANGALNPKAQMQNTVTEIMNKRIERAKQKGQTVPSWADEYEFLKSSSNPMIAYPLRLFDCSLITDGAACVFLASEEVAMKYTDTPIWVIGSGQGSDAFSLDDRDTMTSLRAARVASQQAYQMAGLGPQDIQIAEVHDCFTIAEILAIEDLGFFEKGTGGRVTLEGRTALDGDLPINTSGGLKSKGHPVGASGVAQTVEVFKQLRGEAEKRQVANVEIGLTHNVGGSGSTAVVHIYKR